MADLPIILYEGVEDKAFLDELLVGLGLRERFEFQKGEGAGKDGFKLILDGLVGVNRKVIIIVADNDGDPDGMFKNVQNGRVRTKKAEPQPTNDVNRASGTDSDNGCWLRRLVRPQR